MFVIFFARLADYAFRAWMIMLFLGIIGHPLGFFTTLFGVYVSQLIFGDAALAPTRLQAFKIEMTKIVDKMKENSSK